MDSQFKPKRHKTVAAIFGLFLALAFLVALPGAATAADYYVDSTTGDDANTGLIGSPWKTLYWAANQTFEGTGHTIHVAAGTYSMDSGEPGTSLTFNLFNSTIQGDPAGGTIIDGTGATSWTQGLYFSNCSNVTISNLEIRNVSNVCIYLWDCSGFKITGCKLHETGEAGIFLHDNDAATVISGNIIYDTTYGIWAWAEALTCSPTIINNLIYNGESVTADLEQGIFLDVGEADPVTAAIYHNTIDGASLYGINMANNYLATVSPDIQYNIITNCGTGIADSGGYASTPTIDFNCLFGNTTDYYSATAGSDPGTNYITGDPLYNNTGIADYHLMSGSSCIDAAVTSTTTTDLDGTDRTAEGAYPDIGCYEHLLIPPTDNLPPAAPTCPSPASFTVFAPGQPVTLQGGPYSDPENDSHLSSHWLVTRADVGYFNFIIKGDAPFNHIASTGDLTSYTLGGEFFMPGLAYHWSVGYQDSGSLGYSFPETLPDASLPQRVFVVGALETTSLPPMEPGTEVEDYRMVSITHIPANPSAAAVLGDDLSGGYNTTQYRIGVYDCEMGAGGYREYPDFTVLPGGAAWVLAREGLEADITGVPVTTEVPVQVALRYNAATGNGWNMVGPPNNLDYVWGDVGVVVHDPETGEELFAGPVRGLDAGNPYIDIRLWSWADGAYDAAATMMEAGSGYWVRAKQPHVSLVFPFLFDMPAIDILASEDKGINVWLARSLDYVKQAAEKVFAPASAIAADDEPPPPMASLNYTSGDSSVDMSCFVSTLLEE